MASTSVSINIQASDRTGPAIAGISQRLSGLASKGIAGLSGIPKVFNAGLANVKSSIAGPAQAIDSLTQKAIAGAGYLSNALSFGGVAGIATLGNINMALEWLGTKARTASQSLAGIATRIASLSLLGAGVGLIASFFTQLSTRVSTAVVGLQQLRMQVTQLIMGTVTQLPVLLGQIPMTISMMLSQVRMQIAAAAMGVRTQLTAIAMGIRAQVTATVSALVAQVAAARARVVAGIIAGRAMAVAAVQSAGSAMVATIMAVGGRMAAAGRNIMGRLAAGIRSGIGAVRSAVSAAAGAIANFVPNSPVPEGPLRILNNTSSNPGAKIMDMVAQGMATSSIPDSITIPMIFAKPEPPTYTGPGIVPYTGPALNGPPPPDISHIDLAGRMDPMGQSAFLQALVDRANTPQDMGSSAFLQSLAHASTVTSSGVDTSVQVDDYLRARRGPQDFGRSALIAELARRTMDPSTNDLGQTAFLAQLARQSVNYNDLGQTRFLQLLLEDSDLITRRRRAGYAGRGGRGGRGAAGGRPGGGGSVGGGGGRRGGGGGGTMRSPSPPVTVPLPSGQSPVGPVAPDSLIIQANPAAALASTIINLHYNPIINISQVDDAPDFPELLRGHAREVMDVLSQIDQLRSGLSYD